jgi:hypothetical protein
VDMSGCHKGRKVDLYAPPQSMSLVWPEGLKAYTFPTCRDTFDGFVDVLDILDYLLWHMRVPTLSSMPPRRGHGDQVTAWWLPALTASCRAAEDGVGLAGRFREGGRQGVFQDLHNRSCPCVTTKALHCTLARALTPLVYSHLLQGLPRAAIRSSCAGAIPSPPSCLRSERLYREPCRIGNVNVISLCYDHRHIISFSLTS